MPPDPDSAGVAYFYENVGLNFHLVQPVVGVVEAKTDDAAGVAYFYENVT